MTLAPGSRLGAYEILEAIASGGMGEVFKARQPGLERMVAIKVLRGAARGNPEIQQRFRREIELLSRLSHPHLIHLYDGGHEGEQPYLVMELVEGPTLGAMKSAGLRSVPDFLRLAQPIAEAIEYLHTRGILHRDLKPNNVLVDTEGRPRVTDFGLARSVDATAVTDIDQVVGTPAYMPPEVLEGESWAAPGDIYSLGVIFYELLTGQLPYAATPGPRDYLALVQSGKVIPITSRRKTGSAVLDDLVGRMLARDPVRRPAAAEVVQALVEAERVLDESTVTDVTTKIWKRDPSVPPSRSLALPALTIVTALAVPMGFAMLLRPARETAPAIPQTSLSPPALPRPALPVEPSAHEPPPPPSTWLRHYMEVIETVSRIDRSKASTAYAAALENEAQAATWATVRKAAIREVRALVRAADESRVGGPIWTSFTFECHRLFEHLSRRNQYNGIGDPQESTALLADLAAGASPDPYRRCFEKILRAFCEKSRLTVDEARRQAYIESVDILEMELARAGNEVADRFMLFVCLKELRDKPGVDDAVRRMLQDNPIRDGFVDAVTRRYLGLALETLPRLLDFEPVPAGTPQWDAIVIVVSDETVIILEEYANDRTADSADIVRNALTVLDGCFFFADRLGPGPLAELRGSVDPVVQETAARCGFSFRHLERLTAPR